MAPTSKRMHTCESKAGFSTRQLMNTLMWFLTWNGLISEPLFFLFATTAMADVNWSTMYATCEPPLVVQMEFTKETCWNWPSLQVTAISQRSLIFSNNTGASSVCCAVKHAHAQ